MRKGVSVQLLPHGTVEFPDCQLLLEGDVLLVIAADGDTVVRGFQPGEWAHATAHDALGYPLYELMGRRLP